MVNKNNNNNSSNSLVLGRWPQTKSRTVPDNNTEAASSIHHHLRPSIGRFNGKFYQTEPIWNNYYFRFGIPSKSSVLYSPSPATVSTQHQPISLGLNMSDLDPIGHGSASDYGSKGPRFDSRCRWELGFSLSSLSFILISGTSLIRSLVDVQYYWFSTTKKNLKK